MINNLPESSDLYGYECESTILASYGKGYNKAVVIWTKIGSDGTLLSSYVLKDHGNAILTTINLDHAVERFNSIKPVQTGESIP